MQMQTPMQTPMQTQNQEAKPKANDDPRLTQVHALDGSLTTALLSLIRVEPAEGKELAFVSV